MTKSTTEFSNYGRVVWFLTQNAYRWMWREGFQIAERITNAELGARIMKRKGSLALVNARSAEKIVMKFFNDVPKYRPVYYFNNLLFYARLVNCHKGSSFCEAATVLLDTMCSSVRVQPYRVGINLWTRCRIARWIDKSVVGRSWRERYQLTSGVRLYEQS